MNGEVSEPVKVGVSHYTINADSTIHSGPSFFYFNYTSRAVTRASTDLKRNWLGRTQSNIISSDFIVHESHFPLRSFCSHRRIVYLFFKPNTSM